MKSIGPHVVRCGPHLESDGPHMKRVGPHLIWFVPHLLLLLCLAACQHPEAAGALANVAIATAVGGARMAGGDCFTICAPGTVCNPKTKLCDALPCHDQCKQDEVCDVPSDRCIPSEAATASVKQKHDVNPASSAPVGITPPLSSSPPSSPQHPDVPSR